MLNENLYDLQHNMFEKMIEAKNNGTKIVYWGCGMNANDMFPVLKSKGIVPDYFCYTDAEPGEYMGTPVLPYSEIKKLGKYIIVLMLSVQNSIPVKRMLEEGGEINPIYPLARPYKCENEFLSADEYKAHFEEYKQVYDMFEDEYSRYIMEQVLVYKLTGNNIDVSRLTSGKSFFDPELLSVGNDCTYMDFGAYTGDTIVQFLEFSRGKYSRIIGVDPDYENYHAIEKLVEYAMLDNVELYSIGGWNEKGVLKLSTVNTREDMHEGNSNFFYNHRDSMTKDAEKLLNEHSAEPVQVSVKVDTIDNILVGKPVSIIKVNALGADYQIIEGGKQTICKYKPIIITEYGTQKGDIYRIPLILKQSNNDYKFYLRQKNIHGDSKTVLYAI